MRETEIIKKPYHFIGNNCKLRPLEWADKPQALLWKNNASIRDMQLGFVFPVTEAMEDKWFDSIINPKSNNQVFFAIDCEDKLVGFVSLRDIDWVNKNAKFSISIGTDFQGKGIGKNTLNFMLNYGFNTLNLSKIYLRVIELNTVAINMYLNAGFVKEGILRKQVFQNGNYYDILILGILSSEVKDRLKDKN